MSQLPNSNSDTPGLRKFALTAHITVSAGWLGAVVAYLALAVAALNSQDAQTVRSAWIAMELIGWFAIVPLAIASLLTGLVIALGTPWGLFRHYWVLFKLLLTVFANIILLVRMSTVSYLAGVAAAMDSADLGGLPSDLLHPGAGLLVLLVIMILSVYKPRGLTPYGRRKESQPLKERSSTMDKKRIALVVAVIAVIVAAVVLINVFGTDLMNKFMEMHGGNFMETHRGR